MHRIRQRGQQRKHMPSFYYSDALSVLACRTLEPGDQSCPEVNFTSHVCAGSSGSAYTVNHGFEVSATQVVATTGWRQLGGSAICTGAWLWLCGAEAGRAVVRKVEEPGADTHGIVETVHGVAQCIRHLGWSCSQNVCSG